MAGPSNATRNKKFFSAADLALNPGNATTGVWASQLSGNIYSLHKAAAATTSVVNIPIPKAGAAGLSDDLAPSVIKVFYKVATAGLSGAPTAVLNDLTAPTDTGTVARSAVTQALTFGGLDTVGTAAGDHIAIVTVTTPTAVADTDALILAVTMNEAATSVLDIFGIQVQYV